MTKDRVLPVASPADTLLRELSALPSTQVQNRFGGVLDDLRSHGTIVIERHDRPAAVLMSVEAYTQLHARAQPSQQLNLLTAQFDALAGARDCGPCGSAPRL